MLKKNNLPSTDMPSNRSFGFLLMLILVGLSIYCLWNNIIIIGICVSAVGVLVAVVTCFYDNLLSPLNRLWMKLGLLLGMIISPLILAVVFFGILGPIALLMKISGRDELQLKRRNVDSFWIVRDVMAHPPCNFYQQW